MKGAQQGQKGRQSQIQGPGNQGGKAGAWLGRKRPEDRETVPELAEEGGAERKEMKY